GAGAGATGILICTGFLSSLFITTITIATTAIATTTTPPTIHGTTDRRATGSIPAPLGIVAASAGAFGAVGDFGAGVTRSPDGGVTASYASVDFGTAIPASSAAWSIARI